MFSKKCREEEIEHLDTMKYNCMFHMKNAELSNTHTKVNILMQNSITGAHTDSHSLGSDLMYIQQVGLISLSLDFIFIFVSSIP